MTLAHTLLASFYQELIHIESSINDVKHVSVHANILGHMPSSLTLSF
jgi:hypothetical protein